MANETPMFQVDGAEYDLASMLAANADDADLCEWAKTAAVGDQFPAFIECVRVA